MVSLVIREVLLWARGLKAIECEALSRRILYTNDGLLNKTNLQYTCMVLIAS